MKRRAFLASSIATASFPFFAAAQGVRRPAHIGWVTAQYAPSVAPFVEAFRAGLAELGLVEGRDVTIESRYGNDELGRVAALVKELLADGLDLLVTQGSATFEVRSMKLPVPIVYTMSADPIVAGFAESLARPLGNMTGITLMAVELNGKRLELLREIVPGLRRVAIIGNPEHPGSHLERAFSEQTARSLGLEIDYRPTATREVLMRELAAMAGNPPQAISVLADGFAIQHRQVIIEFANRNRVPVISGWPVFAKSGAVCTYGPRIEDSHRRLAYFASSILKGAKPADLPIERPTKFELVLNQRAAQAIGITLPQALIASADEVLE